jgi:hypothetical protein
MAQDKLANSPNGNLARNVPSVFSMGVRGDAPPPPPPVSGIMFPVPLIRTNVKEGPKLELRPFMAADDADDSSTFLATSPTFRAEQIHVVPLMGVTRHTSWQGGKKVVDNPNSLAPCQFCRGAKSGGDSRDRCENHVEILVAVYDEIKKFNDPSTWSLKGYYMFDSTRTAYREMYTWFYYTCLNLPEGANPWDNTYCIVNQQLRSDKNVWNVPRPLRLRDNPMRREWHRESKDELPEYDMRPTPEHIVAQVFAEFASGTRLNYAASLLHLPGIEQGKAIREYLEDETTPPPVMESASKAAPSSRMGVPASEVQAFMGDIS